MSHIDSYTANQQIDWSNKSYQKNITRTSYFCSLIPNPILRSWCHTRRKHHIRNLGIRCFATDACRHCININKLVTLIHILQINKSHDLTNHTKKSSHAPLISALRHVHGVISKMILQNSAKAESNALVVTLSTRNIHNNKATSRVENHFNWCDPIPVLCMCFLFESHPCYQTVRIQLYCYICNECVCNLYQNLQCVKGSLQNTT